jgi:hypothetical protein
MTALAKKLHDYAAKHYEDGWDTFVECYDMDDFEDFVLGLENWAEVKEMAERLVSVWEDRRAEADYQIKAGG